MTRTNEKQYEECFERLDKYVFSRDMAVKEDKLREYCESNRGYVQGYGFIYREDEKLQEVKNDILDILDKEDHNEGN